MPRTLQCLHLLVELSHLAFLKPNFINTTNTNNINGFHL